MPENVEEPLGLIVTGLPATEEASQLLSRGSPGAAVAIWGAESAVSRVNAE